MVDRTKEKERFSHNMSVLASYFKQYGELLYGITSRRTRMAMEAGELPKFERYAFVHPKQREALLDTFRKYFDLCCDFMLDEHKLLKEQEERMNVSMKEINIDKEVEKKYIVMRTTFDKNWNVLVQLADVLDSTIPQQVEDRVSLVTVKEQPKTDEVTIATDEKDLFDDEFQRSFYRDLVVLKVEHKATAKPEGPEKPPAPEETPVMKDKTEEWRPELEDILKKMPTCTTKEAVDELAKEFCKVSNKRTRKVLVKTMFNIQRTALPLIPLYARMAATLSRVYRLVHPRRVSVGTWETTWSICWRKSLTSCTRATT